MWKLSVRWYFGMWCSPLISTKNRNQPNEKEKEYLVDDRQTNITYCTTFIHALKSCDLECEPNFKVDTARNIAIIINHSMVEKLGYRQDVINTISSVEEWDEKNA